MARRAFQRSSDQGLRRIHAALAKVLSDALQSRTSEAASVLPETIELLEAAEVGPRLPPSTVVVRFALDQQFAGRTLRLALPAEEAALIAGEELAALDEIAKHFSTVLCAALGTTVGAVVQDHATLRYEADAGAWLGEQPLVALGCKIHGGEAEDVSGWLILDLETAKQWSSKSLAYGSDEEDIPQAAIRGKLAAFIIDPDAHNVLRKSCRRVGLELDRRARGDIPNPAAHRDQIVLIEVPTKEDRRFEWCKRLKAYSDSIKVVLLLHHPSRQRVLAGFVAKADALIGWPVQESLVSQKLGALVNAIFKAKELPPTEPVADKT